MKKLTNIIILFLLCNSLYSQSLSPERVEKIKSATVRIIIDKPMGTGFFISDNGLLVTCHHVISPVIQSNGTLKRIFIELNTGEKIEYGIDEKFLTDSNWYRSALSYDFILLKPVKFNLKKKYAFLNLGNFDEAKEGDEIYTCGYPIGIKQQFLTKGIVSTKYTEYSNKVTYNNRAFFSPRSQALLDITLNRGNSGGAIIKVGKTIDKDEVIGIADFIITPVGSQSEEIIQNLISASGAVTISGVDTNLVFAKLFDIISSLSIGVSGCVSINYLTSLLVNKK